MIALISKLDDHTLGIENDPEAEARAIIAFEEVFWAFPQTGVAWCYAIPYLWWTSWCRYAGLEIVNDSVAIVKVTPPLNKISHSVPL